MTRQALAGTMSLFLAVTAAATPTAWQRLDDGDPSRSHALVAYDGSRGTPMILAVGLDGGAGPGIIWDLIDGDWVRRYPPEPVPRVHTGCVAFDSQRGRIVLFGAGANWDETWEFDGTTWVQKVLSVHPSTRLQCSMAYDSVNNRTVLFGGYSTGLQGLGDTWEYDGTAWTQIFPTVSPFARGQAGMSFDAKRGVVVLTSGRNNNAFLADLWHYDARRDRWTQKTPSPGPSARAGPGFAYDPVRERSVLFGGHGPFTIYGDTWEWDGQNWTLKSPPASPEARLDMGLIYDSANQRILGWGGQTSIGLQNDTWTYNGTTWTRIAVSGLPEVRRDFAMAYEPNLDAVVLYGGETAGPQLLSDTWHFANSRWVLQGTAGSAASVARFRLAYDPPRLTLVGFSGDDPLTGEPIPYLHRYSQSVPVWTSSPTCCPDRRESPGWAWSPMSGGELMFGGVACCFLGSYYDANDTWILTGSDWTEVLPSNPPSVRIGPALAYHGASNQAILYGGWHNGSRLQDVWRFDGAEWSLLTATGPPGPRAFMDLVEDAARGVLVLFGDGPIGEGVTWEFDGTTWVARNTPFQPDSTRIGSQLAYDSKREVVILFGGGDSGSAIFFNDTWAYGSDPDGDGIVGGLDNCRTTANANQANLDSDAAGDACDCAPADPTAWATPQPVTGLLASGSGTTSLTWDDQASAIGTGAQYDVATGLLSELHSTAGFGPATCLASRVGVPSASDGRVPPTSDGFYYLARSRNACGIGTYGAVALDAASPCP